ncbi:MAG: hypothetical protein M3Z19_12975 [Chloroflexota bacterium]|nr:hypothetical protein [Chloroflexota bacterium]
MDRPKDDEAQRQATIAAGQGAVSEELTADEAGNAHRKEGDSAVHDASGHEEEVGREGGRTDHLVLDKGDAVPRHPQG